MSTLQILKDEYPGDEAWYRFFAIYLEDFHPTVAFPRLEESIGERDIAVVITVKMGEKGLTWLDQPSKSLEGLSPRHVANNIVGGKKALRTLLMRMPT